MLPHYLMSLILNISGLSTIISLAFTLIFFYEKYPWRKALVSSLISLTILILSLIWFSQAGYKIMA